MATRNMKYTATAPKGGKPAEEVYIEGLPSGGDPAGNATTSTPGLVKQAASLDTISTADATSTASSETVDPTEFASAVALLNEVKAKVNSVISGEKTSGQMS